NGGPDGLTIRADADATINSPIASLTYGTGVFIKTGAASLTTPSSLGAFSRVVVESGELISGKFSSPAASLGADAILTLGDISAGTVSFYAGGLSGAGIVRPGTGIGANTLNIYG